MRTVSGSTIYPRVQRFPLVLEVRHESWNTPEFFRELCDRGIGFVNIDQPLFKKSIKPSASVTSSVGYIACMAGIYRDWFRKDAGVEARYDYLYSKAELKPWAERAKEVALERSETYCGHEQSLQGKAVANAAMLKALVRRKAAVVRRPLMKATRTR
jgi:uncharacterized protein YecE (DUF72 family)